MDSVGDIINIPVKVFPVALGMHPGNAVGFFSQIMEDVADIDFSRMPHWSVELVNLIGREKILREVLQGLEKEYQYIFIDCPPSLGLLTINSLTAAQSVLIPIQCEYYALEGLSQLLKTIRLVQKHLNPNLEIEGVLLTMFDSRLNLSNQVADDVRKFFDDKVFETVIHRNVRLSEAPSFGKPVILYDAVCIGSDNYIRLAEEVINHET